MIRNIFVMACVVLCLGVWPARMVSAGDLGPIDSIQKTVKKNPHYDEGTEVKWLKVLITDDLTDKVRVRVTLPVVLVEIFLQAAEDRHLRVNRDEYELDLKDMFRELKKLGPTTLIEIHEDGETIKIWLE
jgi:hypothetical protein